MILQIPTVSQGVLKAWQVWRHGLINLLLVGLIGLSSWLGWGTLPATAGLTDDRFDGNIFALYAGNGSLVPARVTLAHSLQRQKPALLVFYVDDSSDCKQYASVVNQLQEFYGRASDFIPVDVDTLAIEEGFTREEPGYYYQGLVPQTVLIDQAGEVAFNQTGQIPFEQVDDAFREVFDLLPRSESVELKRRPVNEINTELVEQ